MNFKYFLLLAAPILLADVSPSISLPTQTAPRSIAASNASDTYRNCQQSAAAVVTIYSGREIGSGSIISADGVVITNHHVVQESVRSGGRKQIYVKLASGDRYTGQILGTDTRNDLALVKLAAQKSFPTVPFAGLQPQAGQGVCAIGSPYGQAGVLSQGTFSGFRGNGDLKSAVLLRPGNSGGPLLNPQGEMIGVNKAIWESSSGKNTGISFATSLTAAKNFIARIAPQSLPNSITQVPARQNSPLIAQAPAPQVSAPIAQAPAPVEIRPAQPSQSFPSLALPVPAPERPLPSGSRLGVILDTQNLVVRQVALGSPADMSGLRPGDRIIGLNGGQLSDFEELQLFLNRRPASAVFTVQRNRQLATVQVNF